MRAPNRNSKSTTLNVLSDLTKELPFLKLCLSLKQIQPVDDTTNYASESANNIWGRCQATGMMNLQAFVRCQLLSLPRTAVMAIAGFPSANGRCCVFWSWNDLCRMKWKNIFASVNFFKRKYNFTLSLCKTGWLITTSLEAYGVQKDG